MPGDGKHVNHRGGSVFSSKISFCARESVQLSKQGTLINTKNTKEHEKNTKNPKTNTKTKNHFISLEHETFVELYLKTQKDTKDIKKHKNMEKHTTNTEITKT